MQVKTEKQPKSVLKVTIVVPNEKVKEEYTKTLAEVAKNAEIPGFRKGMAPLDLVKEKIDTNKVYGDVINKLLQTYYTQAVKEQKITPIANPRVEIKEFDLEKDFEFTAMVATRPEVKIKEYKKKLKELQAKKVEAHKEENAKKLAAGEALEDHGPHLETSEVLDAIVDATEVEIADMIVDEETERMMSRLVNQAQSIGLSLEQYLKAQNKTPEQLKTEFDKISIRNLTAEFALANLVKENKIEVTEDEIVETVKASGVPEAEEQLKDPVQKWYIKSVLEKNKLLNSIIEEYAHEHK